MLCMDNINIYQTIITNSNIFIIDYHCRSSQIPCSWSRGSVHDRHVQYCPSRWCSIYKCNVVVGNNHSLCLSLSLSLSLSLPHFYLWIYICLSGHLFVCLIFSLKDAILLHNLSPNFFTFLPFVCTSCLLSSNLCNISTSSHRPLLQHRWWPRNRCDLMRSHECE